MAELIEEAYLPALEKASMEAFEGQYSESQIELKIDKFSIQQKAMELLEVE